MILDWFRKPHLTVEVLGAGIVVTMPGTGCAEDSNSGPSLVPYGGTLGPAGYSFGPNTGLSLSNAVTANGPYSIDIRFYFDSFTGVSNTPYQRILDCRNRESDSGLYSYSDGSLSLFASSYAPGLPPAGPSLGDPHASSAGPVFSTGTLADLLVTRDAARDFSAYVNGVLAFSVVDLDGATNFSGPNNIIWFFVDDFQSLYFYPQNSRSRFRLYRLHQRVGSCCYSGCCSNYYSVCCSNASITPTPRHRPWLGGLAWTAQTAFGS